MSDSLPQPAANSSAAYFWEPWRVWIPLVLLPWMLVARLIPGLIQNAPANIWMVSAFGPLLVSLAILLWFCLASRARWWERLLGVTSIVVILVVVIGLSHRSLVGPLMMVLTIPMTVGGFALGALVFGRTLNRNRLWYCLAVAALLCSVSLFLKTDGVWGNFNFGLQWRWDESAEDRFLAKRRDSDPIQKGTIDESGAQAFLQPQWPG